jgi:uncharacterized cupin superfamily protein
MTVTPDGGQPRGNTAQSPGPMSCGWRGSWQIHETIRKLYVLF